MMSNLYVNARREWLERDDMEDEERKRLANVILDRASDLCALVSCALSASTEHPEESGMDYDDISICYAAVSVLAGVSGDICAARNALDMD